MFVVLSQLSGSFQVDVDNTVFALSPSFYVSLSMSFLFLLFGLITVPMPSGILLNCMALNIAGMWHCPTGAMGDETHCCGLEVGSSSDVGGGGYGTTLPADCHS